MVHDSDCLKLRKQESWELSEKPEQKLQVLGVGMNLAY